MTAEESYRFFTILRMLAGMGVLCINPAECYEITRDKMLTGFVVKAVVPEMRMPKTLLLAEDTAPGRESLQKYAELCGQCRAFEHRPARRI